MGFFQKLWSSGTLHKLLLRCSESGDLTEWEKWKKKHPDDIIRLQGRDFQKAELPLIRMPYGNLSQANCSEINLKNAILSNAVCKNTNFTKADLSLIPANTKGTATAEQVRK